MCDGARKIGATQAQCMDEHCLDTSLIFGTVKDRDFGGEDRGPYQM